MLKKIVGKFRKPKYAKMSNSDKVNHLGEKAIGLFDHMKKAHSDLSEVNVLLSEVIEDEESKMLDEIESHSHKLKTFESNIEKAHNEIGMNTKVQEKLADFIVR